MYDAKAFEKVNDKNFVKKMEKLDKMERFSKSKGKNLWAPAFLCVTALGIYYLWQ